MNISKLVAAALGVTLILGATTAFAAPVKKAPAPGRWSRCIHAGRTAWLKVGKDKAFAAEAKKVHSAQVQVRVKCAKVWEERVVHKALTIRCLEKQKWVDVVACKKVVAKKWADKKDVLKAERAACAKAKHAFRVELNKAKALKTKIWTGSVKNSCRPLFLYLAKTQGK